MLLNRIYYWNLVPKIAHFQDIILTCMYLVGLLISISRQITDIYPAPSSNYPALALIQLGSTFNHNLLYTENRDYIRAFAPQNGKKSIDFKYYSGSIYQFSETRDIIIRRILIKRRQTASIFLHYTFYSSGLNYQRIAYNKHTPYPISNTRSRRREK